MNFKIKLSTIEEVKDFVNICAAYTFEIDLTSGRYTVNAKSIMGIFSLDLSSEIMVELPEKTPAVEKFVEAVTRFMVR